MQSLKQLLESIEHVPIGGQGEHRFCPLCFMGQPGHALDCQLEAWLEMARTSLIATWKHDGRPPIATHPHVKALVEAAQAASALTESHEILIMLDNALAPFGPTAGIPGDEDE